MGGALSWKPSECRQTAQWQTNHRQPLPAFCSDASCLGSHTHERHLPRGAVPSSQASPGRKESGRGCCSQCPGSYLPCVGQGRTLSRSRGRLLSSARQATASTAHGSPIRNVRVSRRTGSARGGDFLILAFPLNTPVL